MMKCAKCEKETGILFEAGSEYERVELKPKSHIVGEPRDFYAIDRVQFGLKDVCFECAAKLAEHLKCANDHYHMRVVWAAGEQED